MILVAFGAHPDDVRAGPRRHLGECSCGRASGPDRRLDPRRSAAAPAAASARMRARAPQPRSSARPGSPSGFPTPSSRASIAGRSGRWCRSSGSRSPISPLPPPAAIAIRITSRPITWCDAGRCWRPFAGWRRLLAPHRLPALLYYLLPRARARAEPDLIVDVGTAIERKMAALAAYRSQFVRQRGGLPPRSTRPGSTRPSAGAGGGAGAVAGCDYAEGFQIAYPLVVRDPVELWAAARAEARDHDRIPAQDPGSPAIPPPAARASSPPSSGKSSPGTPLRALHHPCGPGPAPGVRGADCLPSSRGRELPALQFPPAVRPEPGGQDERGDRARIALDIMRSTAAHAVSAYLAREIVRPRPVRW